MTGCVKYELNRAAGACQIKLYSLTPTGGSFVLCPAHNIQPDLPRRGHSSSIRARRPKPVTILYTLVTFCYNPLGTTALCLPSGVTACGPRHCPGSW